MAKDNIYDKIISELILRIAALTNAATAQLVITTDLPGNSNNVPVGYSGSIVYTSTVQNMPSGYSVSGTTHVITYPAPNPATSGSTDALSGPAIPVSLVTLGATYTVTSTVTLSKPGDPDIVLTGTHTITAVSPAYYGVQPYSATPVTAGLTAMASTDTQFTMTTSPLGRFIVALPVGSPALVSVFGPNGLVYTVVSDFTPITAGGYIFYQLNYDTQLTGTNVKTFTISYS